MRSRTFVCVPCRAVTKSGGASRTCPTCQAPMACTGTRWRPPRRRDDAAWKRIESGHWLTETLYPRGGPAVPTRDDDLDDPLPRRPRTPSSRDRAAAVLSAIAAGADPRMAATEPDVGVRELLARDPDLPPAALLWLLRDTAPGIVAAAVGNPGLPADRVLRRRLLKRPEAVRVALAGRPDLEPGLALRLLDDPCAQVVRRVAGHPAVSARRLRRIPLAWVPEHRLPELAEGPGLKLLAELRANADESLTVARALALLGPVLG